MVALSVRNVLAFAAALPFALAHSGELNKRRRGDDFYCGTQTRPEDLAALQVVAEAGTYEGFAPLRARDRIVGRDVQYPWGNVTIKTWIHVIAGSTNISDGYVPDSQLYAQMAYLNKNFAKTNFQFSLEGITRTINPVWAEDPDGAELQYKTKLRKGDYTTLNLYFLKALNGGALGYAYYPTSAAKNSEEFYLDAASNDAATVPGGAFTNYNLGGTVLHEVGHWMGLIHTFGNPTGYDANGSAIWSCTESTDLIADTPAQKGPTSRCPASRDSCPDLPGLDPIHNWMDYSYDICYEDFTPLQVKRMWDSWFFYRKPRGCAADNCLRALRAQTISGRLEESQAMCSSITQTIVTEVSAFKQYAVDACGGNYASRISSACSCLPASSTSSATSSAATATTTP